MASTEQNSISMEAALEQARAWRDKRATLILSISSEPGETIFCKELWGHLSDVADDGASFAFVWQIVKSDPKVSAKLLVDGWGRFVVWLEGASFYIIHSHKKSMTISRGPYRYVVTEDRASAFQQG
jgi:hypothetical protein